MAQVRNQSPVQGVFQVGTRRLKVGDQKFLISNPSGLGGELKRQGYSQIQIKQVYAWLRGL